MKSYDASILLVDDEAAIRKMLKKYLERNGIAVMDASSGEEALEIVGAKGPDLKFLITDLVMPGLSGRELASRVRRLYPSLPILFMTGYSEQLPDSADDIACMRKPLDLSR